MEIDYDTLFYSVDNFCKSFEAWYTKQLLAPKKKRCRHGYLKLSEVLMILIAYHRSGMACFKYFYLSLCQHGRHLFPQLTHYARFVALIKTAFPALVCLLKSLKGEITEYLFIDATPMAVCHTRREKRHKVFKDLATKGKTSVGYFFGFKLHVLLNTKGEIIQLVISPGHTDDRFPLRDMLKDITAKLIGDKGYISQELFNDLFQKGVTLITKVRKNMKNRLLAVEDKLMLMKRSFIETVFSSLKSLGILFHHRHRSPFNAFCHLLAGLIAYQLRKDKPSLQSFVL